MKEKKDILTYFFTFRCKNFLEMFVNCKLLTLRLLQRKMTCEYSYDQTIQDEHVAKKIELK